MCRERGLRVRITSPTTALNSGVGRGDGVDPPSKIAFPEFICYNSSLQFSPPLKCRLSVPMVSHNYSKRQS